MPNILSRNRELLLLIAILALLLLVALRFPRFIAPANLANVYSDTSIPIILAPGQMAVILTRCIDLSAAATLALCGMVAAMLNFAWPSNIRVFPCISNSPTSHRSTATSCSPPPLPRAR